MRGKREPGIGPFAEYFGRHAQHSPGDNSTSRREIYPLLIPRPESTGPASGHIHPRDDGALPVDVPHQVDSAVQKHPPEVRGLTFSEQSDTGLDSNLGTAIDQLSELIVFETLEQAERPQLIDAYHNVAP